MAWWGKLLGGAFGFMLGGPLGAVLGAALGHSFDRGLKHADLEAGRIRFSDQERIQTAFFTATFAVLGHMAKVDGRVTPEEIRMANGVMGQMGLSAQHRELAQQLFGQGKAPGFPLDDALDQLRAECRGNRNLMRMFVEIQVFAAYADGELHPKENRLLSHVCNRLGLPAGELEHIDGMVRAELNFQRARSAKPSAGLGLDDAYAILGVTRKTPDKEVTTAYRRLMSQHHPDKLVAKGLPEEMMQMAKEKTQDIKLAYERVKEARGI
jgi:DnaJ like chaperone protein